MIKLYSIFLLILFTYNSFSQENNRSIFVKYTNEKIVLDGILDEESWKNSEKTEDFWQYFPLDSVKSTTPTEVKMTYNDSYIYVGIKAVSKDNKFIVNSLRRDFAGPNNDNVSIVFDTFSDGTNGFVFSANPYGVQREAFISNGGNTRDTFNASWDVKWLCESKIYENYYILEMAIPFSSIKFKEGSQQWRFQSYRFDLQTNEQSAWGRVPQNQILANLAFLGTMNFEKPLGKNKTPFYVIPYINAITSHDYISKNTTNKVTIGADAKLAIGSGLNLDITANPDFSNVEVDNIITNTTRFEISLPEKRQFFIDNGDLFSNFGNTFNEAKPFFSRRIGIVRDANGNNVENKILGGMRLSGKLDANWRLGILNLQSSEDTANNIVSNNNGMIAIQRKVFSRSNIGAFVVNRQTLSDYDFQNPKDKYNRVIGMDYNLASKNGRWNGRMYAHKSFQPDDKFGNLSSQVELTYNTRNYSVTTDWVFIDKDFRADLGFVPRTNIFKSGNSFARTFYPKNSSVNKFTPRVLNIMIFDPKANLNKTDHLLWLSQDIEFKNHAQLGIRYSWQYVYLNKGFDPTRTVGAIALPNNSEYKFNQATVLFTSNNTKTLSFVANATFGQFYNGIATSITGTGNLRIMPKTLLSLSVNYDKINLPAPYPSATILIISPKADITFTKSLFWSTLVQYSNRQQNLGINSRLQWRFAPLSDLFLVYNDNYYTQDLSPRFRSLNLKFSYWI